MSRPLANRTQKQIAELTRAGKSQREIAKTLGVDRNSVYNWQRRLGLPARKVLDAATKTQILALLQEGVSQRRIEKRMNVSTHHVRQIARAHHIAPYNPIRGDALLNVLEAILHRADAAFQIAKKNAVSYKKVLRLAHQILKCEKFLSNSQPPLESYFPSRGSRAIEPQEREAAFLELVSLITRTCPDLCALTNQQLAACCVQICLHYIPQAVRAALTEEQSQRVLSYFDTAMGQAVTMLRQSEAGWEH